MSPVSRLHHTWQAFNDKWPSLQDEYDEISELVSPKGQYANYRRQLKELELPAIPFLGICDKSFLYGLELIDFMQGFI
jgi:hypothetical protein